MVPPHLGLLNQNLMWAAICSFSGRLAAFFFCFLSLYLDLSMSAYEHEFVVVWGFVYLFTKVSTNDKRRPRAEIRITSTF